MLKLAISLSFILFPFYVIALNLYYSKTLFVRVVSALLIIHAMLRTWETFYTTHDRKRHKLHGDWTLALSTAVYVAYHFLFTTELFSLVHEVNIFWLISGILLYVMALRVRVWGEASLGSQWSIHAVGARKVKKVRILRVGPYKYVRHPVYLGIILESISLGLITNAFFSLFFALVIFIPIMIIRAKMEEKTAIRRFGLDKYEKYRLDTKMFFDLKLIPGMFGA